MCNLRNSPPHIHLGNRIVKSAPEYTTQNRNMATFRNNNLTAMRTDVQDRCTLSSDNQDASVARHNLLIEAWLLDLVPSAAPALSPSPVGPSGKKRKRRQYRPVLGEMDRNVRKMQSINADQDIEMDEGNEIAGPARAPKTPSASPTKQKIVTSRRKGYGKAVREGSGMYSCEPHRQASAKICHSGPD